jgi:hypothetical protein
MAPSSILLCMVSKNKSITTTTLHSAMNLNMLCMSKGIQLEIHFVPDRSGIQKFMKSSERLLWLDYGVSIDVDTLNKLAIDDFPDGYRALIAPCVLEGVDWEMFRKKTLEGSKEPANQRGLRFDTVATPASKKMTELGISDFVSSSTDGRVFSLDCKPILKKLRDGDTQFKTFDQLKKLGVKIGVLGTCSVLCHYVYESIGNILESSGVRTGP